MCGIAGIVRFDGAPIRESPLRQAAFLLRHRGPDQEGVWLDRQPPLSIGLAAVRLAVQDPSDASRQPIHDSGGRFHLVYNGELYNFRLLRRELSDLGFCFHTEGDSEVVLAALAHWGPNALDRFNGMWAFAFYDSVDRTGILSRDRFGIKPLLYRTTDKVLCFASELRAFEALTGDSEEPPASLDPEALLHYVHFGYVGAPRTIRDDVRTLEPAHYLRFGPGGSGPPQRYFEPSGEPGTPVPPHPTNTATRAWRSRSRVEEPDYALAATRLRRTMSDAVVARRVADVPVGAFLSSGIDSAIVTLHLREAMGSTLHTFSLGYGDARTYDESSAAADLAAYLGTEHHEIILTESMVAESVPRILDQLGEPFGDSSIIPTAILSEFARRSVTVALSGDGGDELWGGYWRYLGHAALELYERVPKVVRAQLRRRVFERTGSMRTPLGARRFRQWRKLTRWEGSDPWNRHLAWSRILAPEAEGILAQPNTSSNWLHSMAELMRRRPRLATAADPLDAILLFDLTHQLPDDMLHKVDRASMLHSLEVRVPFLDPTVVAHALSLPVSFKIDRGLRKRILRDAYRGRLPDDLLDRPKRGFEVPIGDYFRGPLGGFLRDTVNRTVIESLGIFRYDQVERVIDDHVRRRADHSDLLFSLLSLCWWRARDGRRLNG